MKLTSKKILVTGADGFIGSHLVELLVKTGNNVRAFVYYNALNSWGWLDQLPQDIKESIDIFVGDVRDPNGVRQAVRGCDVIMHLAALIGIPYSYCSPDSYVATNINGTLNLLQAARDENVRRFVHTSTSEVYGTAVTVPIDESHPLRAQSPYAATKIAADELALSFHCSFDLPVVVIRPFNTYGPRQSARAVIPTIITQLANRLTKVKLGATHTTRDFNYVEDVVQAFLAVAQADAVVGEVINIGTGYEISIGELAGLIAELMGVPLELEFDGSRSRPLRSEVERLVADPSKALRLTGWKPSYSGREGLRAGLEKTMKWFTHVENLSWYKADICNV